MSQQQFDIGIDQVAKENICQSLTKILADTYLLYIKTQNFHWNVEGENFKPLHELFEEQYENLAEAIDTLAERIRALGHYVNANYAAFSQLSRIKEANIGLKAQDMVRQLAEDHALIIRFMRSQYAVMDAGKDEATADLITQRMQVHEKMLWMLRSFLSN